MGLATERKMTLGEGKQEGKNEKTAVKGDQAYERGRVDTVWEERL